MSEPLSASALETLFLTARTQNAWKPEPVSDETLVRLYDILKMGPTSANCSPARFVFVKTPEGKEKLKPAMSAGNLAKTMAAPVNAIVAYDKLFYDHLGKLFPHEPNARSWFAASETGAEEHGFRNGTLQGAYLMLAARSLGLDCGPMSGFDRAKVDEAFFAGTSWKSNFLVNLGHGDPKGVQERLPRLDFSEACQIV